MGPGSGRKLNSKACLRPVADLDKNLSGFLYGRGPISFWQRPCLLSKIGRRPYSLFDKIRNCKIQY